MKARTWSVLAGTAALILIPGLASAEDTEQPRLEASTADAPALAEEPCRASILAGDFAQESLLEPCLSATPLLFGYGAVITGPNGNGKLGVGGKAQLASSPITPVIVGVEAQWLTLLRLDADVGWAFSNERKVGKFSFYNSDVVVREQWAVVAGMRVWGGRFATESEETPWLRGTAPQIGLHYHAVSHRRQYKHWRVHVIPMGGYGVTAAWHETIGSGVILGLAAGWVDGERGDGFATLDIGYIVGG